MDSSSEIRAAILEDHLMVREVLQSLLERSGIAVAVNESDERVFLERVTADPPSVAVLAVPRPGRPSGDGLDILAELREARPEVRTIALSSSDSPEVTHRCYALGASGFLFKGTANLDSVISTVRGVAAGNRMLPFQQALSSLEPRGPNVLLPASPISQLTPREREVLSYVTAGVDNLKIATLIGVAERTVRSHVSALYRKLGAPENRTQLALLGRRLGIRPPPEI
jgi:DNA-binding NarL/FixJ family response regulator